MNEIVQIQDKRASDGSMVTDGVGMIRDSKAQEVCNFHGLSSDTCGTNDSVCIRLHFSPYPSSVFQIRLGGTKGLLVRYPNEDFDRLVNARGKQSIALRPSMIKYKSDFTQLEICGVSRRRGHARLNIQFILLLLTLGIDNDVSCMALFFPLFLCNCLARISNNCSTISSTK